MMLVFFIFLGAWCAEDCVEQIFLPPEPHCASVVAEKDADIMVVHFPSVGRASYAVFRENQAVVAVWPMTVTLGEGLREQILAGYRLFPDIAMEEVTTHKNFFAPGVREHISECQPFLSEDLEWRFGRIEELLHQRASLSLRQEGRWKKMDADLIKEKIYPEGKTRIWSVIPRKKVGRYSLRDTVCITFKGEPVALEGRLCRRSGDTFQEPRSLWECAMLVEQRSDLARNVSEKPEAWWMGSQGRSRRSDAGSVTRSRLDMMDKRVLPHWRTVCFSQLAEESAPFVERFFSRILPERVFHRAIASDLYICCVQEGSLGVVEANADLQVSTPMRCSGKYALGWSTAGDAFWHGFLRGFALKRPKHGCENVELFTVPQVRKVVCKKQSFVNTALQDVFSQIIGDLEKRLGKDSTGARLMLETLLPERQHILWSIEDRDTFLDDVLIKRRQGLVCPGTVFVVMRREPAVLKGVPVSARYKDNAVQENLGIYWFQEVIAPKIRRAQLKTQ